MLDASPLIYLGKADRLDLLPQGSVVPKGVYGEVLAGEGEGEENASRVKEERGGSFEVQKVGDSALVEVRAEEESLGLDLGIGEEEAIALAFEEGGVLLSDDSDAKRLAREVGIEGRGTLYLLLRGVREERVSKEECSELFREIVDSGLWVSPDVVSEFHSLLGRVGPDDPLFTADAGEGEETDSSDLDGYLYGQSEE